MLQNPQDPAPLLHEVVLRLRAEFGDAHPDALLSAVVGQCRADLQGSPPGAMPELVERLARQRLLDPVPAEPAPVAAFATVE